MFSQAIMTQSKEETIFIFNDYYNKTGILPKVIQVMEFTPLYGDPLVDDNTIKGSVFLPPYIAMQILIDTGNFQAFSDEYNRYLNSEIPEESIGIILFYSMEIFNKTNGGGLVIFNFENTDSGYLDILLGYLYFKYGISLIPECPNNYNFGTLSNIYNNLLAFNLITIEEFLDKVPKLNDGSPNIFPCNYDKLK